MIFYYVSTIIENDFVTWVYYDSYHLTRVDLRMEVNDTWNIFVLLRGASEKISARFRAVRRLLRPVAPVWVRAACWPRVHCIASHFRFIARAFENLKAVETFDIYQAHNFFPFSAYFFCIVHDDIDLPQYVLAYIVNSFWFVFQLFTFLFIISYLIEYLGYGSMYRSMPLFVHTRRMFKYVCKINCWYC